MSKTRKFKRVQRLRRILRGRKKTGRKTFSYTIALTYKQIEWLTERYRNSSELFRRLLDDHIKSMDKVEPDVVKLGYKLKRLVAEKEAKEEEQGKHRTEKDSVVHKLWQMEKQKRFHRAFLQTPEDQVKMEFPEKGEEYPTVWVSVTDESGEELSWQLSQARGYTDKRRQDVLDIIKREIEHFHEKQFEEFRREKAIYDAVQSAFDENIRLLEEEINKVVEEISLINKQTNKDS